MVLGSGGANVLIRILAKDEASAKLSGLDSKFGSLVKSLGLTALAATAAKKAFDFTKESIELAARVETLGVVTEVMGKNAGYTAAEVRKLEAGIQSMGITTQASRQSLAQMMRAEIDLAKATDLARLAQDAAVISGENSSEAFEKLTQIIGTGNTFMARRMGLLVDFEGAYKSLADSLGKPVDALTQLEKVQARTNEVMAQGTTISGAYEAAMETAGKQLLSYPRYLEELKLAFGEGFQDIFSDGIVIVTEFTKNLGEAIKAENRIKDAAEAGIISRLEANRLINKATWTTYTFAEAIKYLEKVEREGTKVQYEWNEAVDLALKWGIRWDDLLDQISDGTIDGAEATLILNERLEEQIPIIQGIATAAEDADDAMLGYAAAVQAGTLWTFRGEEAFTRYGAAQAIARDRAEEGGNAAIVAGRKIRESLEAAAAAALSAAEGMQTYLGIFDTTDKYAVAEGITDAFVQRLGEMIFNAAAAGESIEPYVAALAEIDPVAAAAYEKAGLLDSVLDGLQDNFAKYGDVNSFSEALDNLLKLEPKDITPLESGAAAINALGLAAKENQEAMDIYTAGLEAGEPPVTAMGEALEKVGVVGPDAIGVLGQIITDLEGTHAPADGLLSRLEEMVAQVWEVKVNVTYTGGYTGGPGWDPRQGENIPYDEPPKEPKKPYVPVPPPVDDEPPYIGDYQHGTGGWRRVPLGYPDDSYRVGLSSGEKFNVVPAGGNGGGGGGITIGDIIIHSNQDPQEIAQEVIRELQYRMS